MDASKWDEDPSIINEALGFLRVHGESGMSVADAIAKYRFVERHGLEWTWNSGMAQDSVLQGDAEGLARAEAFSRPIEFLDVPESPDAPPNPRRRRNARRFGTLEAALDVQRELSQLDQDALERLQTLSSTEGNRGNPSQLDQDALERLQGDGLIAAMRACIDRLEKTGRDSPERHLEAVTLMTLALLAKPMT